MRPERVVRRLPICLVMTQKVGPSPSPRGVGRSTAGLVCARDLMDEWVTGWEGILRIVLPRRAAMPRHGPRGISGLMEVPRELESVGTVTTCALEAAT